MASFWLRVEVNACGAPNGSAASSRTAISPSHESTASPFAATASVTRWMLVRLAGSVWLADHSPLGARRAT